MLFMPRNGLKIPIKKILASKPKMNPVDENKKNDGGIPFINDVDLENFGGLK